MSFTSLGWKGASGRDLHLLPGLVGPNLRQLLDFRSDDPDDDPDTLTVTFGQSFDADEAEVGVTVDEHTGEVTVSDPFPPPAPPDGPLPTLHFFIIEVRATDGADLHLRTRIRVQIHQSISSMWLTPSPLTVRVDTTDVRFSVLAQFDDDSIGDITTWSPFITPGSDELTFVHADGEDTPVLEWSAEGDGITVSADTGQLDCSDPAATGVRVSATVNAAGQPPPATGEARGGPSWSTPVRLAHVRGPGYKAMIRDDVHNILFLPDGFVASERDAYETLVMGIVNLLGVMPHTRPFDILGKRLNYFTAWVPSPAAGMSPLFEMLRITQTGTNATGMNFPDPAPPPGGLPPPRLTLAHLIYTVGLPLPNRDHPGDPLGDEDNGNLHDWLRLYNSPEAAQVTPTVYDNWLALTSRVLLNETDTAFTMCAGARPTADSLIDPSVVQFHPLRGMRDDLDTFLKALVDEDGNAIPDVWSRGMADDTLVVFLTRCMFFCGSNSRRGGGARYVGNSLDDQDLVPMSQNATNGWDFAVEPVPGKASVSMWASTAHEIAHSFQLADEYGGGGQISKEDAAKVAPKPNVQAASDLDAVPAMSTAKIKWRWPRIQRAGILAADVVDASGLGAGPFTLTLQAGHGESFAKDDFARLRTRKLLDATMSGRIRITAVAGDTLKAEGIPGEAFVPSEWKAGSVVIVPRREADPNFPDVLGDDQLLIAASTLARMDQFHNPLNMLETDPPDSVSAVELRVPTAATLFPNGQAPKPPEFSSWYVGLFDNGDTFDTGVYRPTGICLMSRQHFINRETGIDTAYQFCPVCRYWLVDLIDPSQHRWIDIDFAARYPA